jgi:hypothetical protein
MATAKKLSIAESLRQSYTQLLHSSAKLNAASDQLTEAVSIIDKALKTFNLGVSTWIEVIKEESEEEDGRYSTRYLGYAKIGNKWGIGIWEETGNGTLPAQDPKDRYWLFGDAPRKYRIEAIRYLPNLLASLTEHAERTAGSVQHEARQTHEAAMAISEVAASLGPRK